MTTTEFIATHDLSISASQLRRWLSAWSDGVEIQENGLIIAERVQDPLRPRFAAVWAIHNPNAILLRLLSRPKAHTGLQHGDGWQPKRKRKSQKKEKSA